MEKIDFRLFQYKETPKHTVKNRRKKILIVSECFFPEEFKINDVALSWAKKNYEVHVLTLVPTYPLGQIIEGYENRIIHKGSYQDVTVYRVGAVTGYRDSRFRKILRFLNFMFTGSLVALFIGKRYDYIFGFNAGALTSMLPAVLITKVFKKPLMFWVQDVWPDSLFAYGFRKNKLTSYLLDRFVCFMHSGLSSIAVSGRGFEKKLRPYVSENLPFNYLPNWADDIDLTGKEVSTQRKGVTHFTFAGNIGKQQNLENVIRAFTSMSSEYLRKSQLNIIGDGDNLKRLQEISTGHCNIVFHGKQKRSDMGRFYAESDFLILSLVDDPVFSVTVPAKTQTYISAKRPILAIISGDTADLVNDFHLGLCAHPSDINEICQLFCECIDMGREERLSYTRRNDELLATLFDKKVIIETLLAVLEKGYYKVS